MAAAAAEEDHSAAGKGRKWKRRRNGLPNKKSAIVVDLMELARGLEQESSRSERSWNGWDGNRTKKSVGRRVDEGLNYERVHVRRWFQNRGGTEEWRTM